MARLAAQEKGEYYPTPPAVAEAIANASHVLSARDEPILRLFDPCAGEGLALARIAEILRQRTDHEVQTWGVEINPRRAALAAERLDVVVEAPFEVAGWKPAQWGNVSLPLLTWEEWMRRNGVARADLRPTRSRRREASAPLPGQLALGF